MVIDHIARKAKEVAAVTGLVAALASPMACGDDATNNQYTEGGEYTCESGSRMIVDLCCEAEESGCPSDYELTWFSNLYGACKDKSSVPQKFFECCYDACQYSGDEQHNQLNSCEQKYFK
ncbi:hypothetical protein KKB44_05825 [Candidatus Micrarchaeota archaeon]|nr:hypothetical protein [Candidatus Micrarchaeota archaeon]